MRAGVAEVASELEDWLIRPHKLGLLQSIPDGGCAVDRSEGQEILVQPRTRHRRNTTQNRTHALIGMHRAILAMNFNRRIWWHFEARVKVQERNLWMHEHRHCQLQADEGGL